MTRSEREGRRVLTSDSGLWPERVFQTRQTPAGCSGKCYPQKCVFLRIRAYPQKCLRRSDFWQKKAKLSRFFGEMPDQSCLYW